MSNIGKRIDREIAERVRDQQPALMLKFCRDILQDKNTKFKPSSRDDWKAVDAKMASIMVLHLDAVEKHVEFILEHCDMEVTTTVATLIFYATTYKNALFSLLTAHTTFQLEGVYRDGNADWYYDRLYSAIEGTIQQSQGARLKAVEKFVAKIRSAD